MRTVIRTTVLLLLASMLAACASGASSSPSASVAASASASASADASASAEPSASASAGESVEPSAAASGGVSAECMADNLQTMTSGTLTVGTDNPAFPPYFEGREGGNTEPWDPEWGDPTTGEGFESAVAYAVAEALGFAEEDVTWTPIPFNNSFAPGPKEFDFFIGQVTFNEERTQGADLSEGYYFGNQTVVTLADSEFADATSIADLKEATLGAQIGTTSLATIEEVIQTTPDAAVFNTTDDAIEAMTNGQIDGIVVDLPTASFITNVQIENGTMVGQIGESAGAQPEYFSLVLDKDSPLTDCVNEAVTALTDDGTIDALTEEWLPFDAEVPELQP